MCARFHGAVRNRRNLPPMPNRSKVLATALLLLTLGHDAMEARAQDPATQDAGIYWLYVHMAPELTTEYAVEVTDRKVLSGYSESAIFPDALLDSVRMLCPVEPLVEEVERRNRLRIAQPWLEFEVGPLALQSSTMTVDPFGSLPTSDPFGVARSVKGSFAVVTTAV